MSRKRRQFTGDFKFRVALEAVRGLKTTNEMARAHEVHPNQIGQWKRHLLDQGCSLFEQNGSQAQQEQASRESELYEQIGRLKVELDWLKKKSAELR